jgi:endogenous inhibitor of DNA gyrase (YacG/DUF329 family)
MNPMPPRKNCPHCGIHVEDWFREWYPYEEQPQIFQGMIAADCPNCQMGVKLTKDVEKAPPGAPVLSRSRAAAEKWVQREKIGLYGGLDDFLQSSDPAAHFFRNYQFRP